MTTPHSNHYGRFTIQITVERWDYEAEDYTDVDITVSGDYYHDNETNHTWIEGLESEMELTADERDRAEDALMNYARDFPTYGVFE